MKITEPEDKQDWMATMPSRPTQEDEWFSEHDFRLGDGYDYTDDLRAGIRIDGCKYEAALLGG